VKLLQDAIRNHGRVDLMSRRDGKGGQNVAVKRMPTSWVTKGPSEFKKAYPRSSELPWCDIGVVGHLNSIKYPYVCDLMGVYRDHSNTYVVSSFATQGDLFGWCENEPLPGPQREATILPLAKQIFAAVRWLHNLGIAHRDISLENILLTDAGGGEMRIKLIDFGMATLSKSCVHEIRGKASYQAPEMHGEAPCDPMAFDHFALGVVLFAMASQDYPWSATSPKNCQLFEYVRQFGLRKFLSKRRVRKGPDARLSDVLSPDFVELIEGMMAFDPAERATLDEICYANGPKANRSIKSAKWLKRRR
jgi:serine/threonine protein kinase